MKVKSSKKLRSKPAINVGGSRRLAARRDDTRTDDTFWQTGALPVPNVPLAPLPEVWKPAIADSASLTRCPKCKKQVSKNRLIAHTQSVCDGHATAGRTALETRPLSGSVRGPSTKSVHKAPLPRDFPAPTPDVASPPGTTTKSLVRCSRCHVNVRQDRMGRHIQRVHAGDDSLSSATTKTVLQTSNSKQAIRASEREKPTKTTNDSAGKPRAQQDSPNQRVQCPKCRDTVVKDRLGRHLLRVHNTSLPSTTQPPATVAPPSKKSATGTPPTPYQAHGSGPKKGQPQDRAILRSGQQKTTTNAPREKQRESEDERRWEPRRAERRGQDGSSGVGHFAREDGRFGSFPSFDPMDDESGA